MAGAGGDEEMSKRQQFQELRVLRRSSVEFGREEWGACGGEVGFSPAHVRIDSVIRILTMRSVRRRGWGV